MDQSLFVFISDEKSTTFLLVQSFF